MTGAWLGVLIVLAFLSYTMPPPERLRIKEPAYKISKRRW